MAVHWLAGRYGDAMTLVIAHRGASVAARENTLPAFRRAGKMGADGVELDARLTSDGHLVVHHDPRLRDGRTICETRADDLPKYVPGLNEALDACRGMFVNIEVKNDATEPDFDPDDRALRQVLELLHRRGESQRWLISSFRLDTLAVGRQLVPDLRTAWLVEEFSTADIEIAADAGHEALHPWVHTLTADLVRAAHGVGLAINTWTCNDPERLAELMAWGVDGICTDVPDVALAVRTGIPARAGET